MRAPQARTTAQEPRSRSRPRSRPNPFDHVMFGVDLRRLLPVQLEPAARPREPAARLRHARERLRHPAGGARHGSAPDVTAGRRFGRRVDLQFGQATETVQGGPANEPRPDVYRHIWQAYGTYVFPVGRGLQADFGKFASKLGYETNYAKDNNQFSRAYLFNFLPFYHSGLRHASRQRQGDGDVHADQRHPADRGFQRLQEQPLRGHRQADQQGGVDDQLLLRPGTTGWRRTRRAGRLLPRVRHLCVIRRRRRSSASAST